MTVTLTKVIENDRYTNKDGIKSFTVVPVDVNPELIVSFSPNEQFKSFLKEGLLPDGLDERQEFTTIITTRDSFVVIGSHQIIKEKINKSSSKEKILLKS